ncbi:MAG: DUF2752 domain-containing protein [Clostridia bacterium]|nr:DUF2752 domain-containing protein [Clostridia bacterium]
MINFIKKNYNYINITIISLCGYAIIYVFGISRILEKYLPKFVKCAYLQYTGKPCPLCGGTRYIRNISEAFNDISYLFNFFGFIVLVFVFELVFRIILLTNRKEKSKKIVVTDILIHSMIFVVYFIYIVMFFICN